MRKLIAIAAAALFALPAFAAPVLAPGQTGAVGANVACTNLDGVTIRCIQPSVTLNDATGAAIGTAASPLFTAAAPSSASAAGVAPAASTSAEACHVFKASAGNAYSLSGYIGAAGYLMVFNAIAAPADGAVTPKTWAYSPAAGNWSLDYGAVPAYFDTGITVCASSTGPLTKTGYSTNTVFAGRVQ